MQSIKRVIGTSVGSIFATLAACKCTNEEIDKYFAALFDKIVHLHEGFAREGYNLIEKLGVHDNSNIYEAVQSFLLEKFNSKNMTFLSLFEKTGIELTIVGTCLTTRSAEFFSHLTFPEMEIAKAIQISTAIPLFFTIVKWNEKDWVDGGLVENFAIEHYDDKNGKYNKNTLGLYLLQDDEKKQDYKINNIVDLLEGIENLQLDNNIKQSISHYTSRNIIYIKTGSISSINFAISENDKKFLIDNGYSDTKKFFENSKTPGYFSHMFSMFS
jgi:NTE family protein